MWIVEYMKFIIQMLSTDYCTSPQIFLKLPSTALSELWNPPGGLNWNSADPGLELDRVEKKQGKKKPGVTRQDPVKTQLQTR
jgi:hypothetical protein